jgi:hypothetical protein
MQRVKLEFVGLVALMGVFALSGCQVNPDRAASIGDFSIDHADVDAMVNTIQNDLENAKKPAEPYGDVRRAVVEFALFNELARRYAKEQGVSVPAIDYAAAARQTGLPADDPFVRLSAEATALRTGLLARARPGTPTEADYREVYDRYKALAGDQASTYEEVRPQMTALPDIATGVGLRDELLAAASRYGVVVNPRYAPLSVPLTALPIGSDSNGQPMGQLTLVSLPLGDQGTGAVRDV